MSVLQYFDIKFDMKFGGLSDLLFLTDFLLIIHCVSLRSTLAEAKWCQYHGIAVVYSFIFINLDEITFVVTQLFAQKLPLSKGHLNPRKLVSLDTANGRILMRLTVGLMATKVWRQQP
jgi:hypothetical protein